MAARTFTSAGVNNLWTNAANWDTAPVDNDSVTIPNGQTCEYDADMSNAGVWPNGIAGITITGTLSLTRTAGTYYLKIKAATTIAGAGTFDCGTSGSPIPFAAKHTITGGSGWYIDGAAGLTMTVYAAEPAIKTIHLTALEPIGETVLAVDTDITGDIWADGDTIRIDNVNRTDNSEARVIAAGGRAAGTITITVGLTTAKLSGTHVHLITRNVRFVANNGYVARNFATGKLTITGGEFQSTYRIFNESPGMVVSGGTFSGAGEFGLYICNNANISGGVFSGNAQTTNACSYLNISGGIFTGSSVAFQYSLGYSVSGGEFAGNAYVFNAFSGSSILGGTFTNNGVVIMGGAGITVFGGVYSANGEVIVNSSGIVKNVQLLASVTDDINQSVLTLFNTLLNAATEYKYYSNLSRSSYSESFDHDQTAGAFRSWTKGGITSSQAGTKPTGYTSAMQTVLESATSEGFWQKEVLVAAGASVDITMNLRKDAAMGYLPRCIIFNKAATDPFAGGAGIHTFTMTNSVDTWEAETYTYSNNTANDVTIVIRIQGMNATGNVFSALTVDVINVDLTSALAILNDLHDTHIPAIKTDTAAILIDTGTDIPAQINLIPVVAPPTVVAIRQEMDANSSQLSGIKSKTDNLPSDPADESLLEAAIAAIPVAPTVSQILDDPSDGLYTPRQILRLLASAIVGKATGGGTATITFRDINDTKNRIVATVDINGNRSLVILDPL